MSVWQTRREHAVSKHVKRCSLPPAPPSHRQHSSQTSTAATAGDDRSGGCLLSYPRLTTTFHSCIIQLSFHHSKTPRSPAVAGMAASAQKMLFPTGWTHATLTLKVFRSEFGHESWHK